MAVVSATTTDSKPAYVYQAIILIGLYAVKYIDSFYHGIS